VRRWQTYDEALADLEAVDADERVALLVTEYAGETLHLSTEEVRRLFVFAWDDSATPVDLDHDVLRMLRWIAPVRDEERYLSGTLAIFRPADGDDRSIRWTLDEQRAGSASGNGIVRASVAATNVLAHFTAGGADQVLVDPDDLSDVEPAGPAV
jgi:hypothetical protein